MKIARITLKNFTSYRYEQSFSFGTDDKYVTVFEGQMGHGKSNLLNAFYWCIFNQYWDSDGARLITNPDPYQFKIFNLAALQNEATDGNKVSLFVEIEFWDDEGNKYTLNRSQNSHFMMKKWKFDNETKLKLEKVNAEDGQSSEFSGRAAEAELELYFPSSLSQYFLFRGENRAQLVKLQGKQEFQIALKELSKIEVFNRSIRHLNKAIGVFQVEAGDLASEDIKGDIIDASNRKLNAEKVLEDYNDQLTNLENIKQQKIDDYESLSAQIRKNEATHKLQKERDGLEKDKSILIDKQDDLLKNRNFQLARKWSSLVVKDILEKTSNRYSEAVSSGSYPPNIHPSVIKKILHDLRCICGRDIDEGSIEYKLINQLKSQESYDKIIREVESLMSENRRVKDEVDKFPLSIQDFDDKNNVFKRQISEKRKAINLLEKQIGDTSFSMEELLKKQKEAKDDEVKTAIKIDQVSKLIDTKAKELKDIDKELEELEKKLDQSHLPVIKLSLARKALKETERLKKKFEETIYQDLEKYTQEHWDLLVYDKLNYERIELDKENMYFDVFDKHNNSRRSSMNTGHSILLVLSFISSLIRIAKETWKTEFPLVLDAPLSEIGDTAMPKALNGFGEVFNQAIVILKDGSVTPYVSEELKDKIGKRYWIEYNELDQHSKITEKNI